MSHDIQTLEITKEEAQRKLNLLRAMERLQTNEDFRLVVEEELLDNYARNTVYLLSDPNMQDAVSQTDLVKDLEMIGRFRQFLGSVFQNGRIAEKTIADADAEIDELRAEGADE